MQKTKKKYSTKRVKNFLVLSNPSLDRELFNQILSQEIERIISNPSPIDKEKIQKDIKRKDAEQYMYESNPLELARSLGQTAFSDNMQMLLGNFREALSIGALRHRKGVVIERLNHDLLDVIFFATVRNKTRRILLEIKSASNTCNATQKQGISERFRRNSSKNTICILGQANGRNITQKIYGCTRNSYELCGNAYWNFILGIPNAGSMITEVLQKTDLPSYQERKKAEYVNAYLQVMDKAVPCVGGKVNHSAWKELNLGEKGVK